MPKPVRSRLRAANWCQDAAELEFNRFELTEVFKNLPVKVDIVFVHGLDGHPKDTWTSEKSKTFWPSLLLPPFLEEENTRILVYGYDADVTSFTDGVGRDKIHHHAEKLVADLAANRRVSLPQRRIAACRGPVAKLSRLQIRKATERPIIFVAHSLGGLVVKRVRNWCLWFAVVHRD